VRTALVTFGYGRPDHFKRMLTGLGSALGFIDCDIDIHHYLDGGHGSQQNEIVEVIEVSGVPYTKIVRRPENFGVGRQLIGARREIFDEQGYDRMILMEDDVEPGPSFLTALLRLSDWAHTFSDVGTVQAWNVHEGGEEDLKDDLDKVVLTNRHFVTYCLTKSVWDAIKPALYEYEERFLLDRPYAKRANYRIRFFMRHWMKKARQVREGKRLDPPEQAVSNPFPRVKFRHTPSSQDSVTSMAIHQAGFVRLALQVPRAYYFGETGVHITPDLFREMNFHLQGHHVWSPDSEPEAFTMRYKDDEGNWLHSFYR